MQKLQTAKLLLCLPQEPEIQLEDKKLLESAPKALEDGSKGEAAPVATLADARENLSKFVESLHQKASALTSWISNLEPPTNPNPSERAKKFFI